MPQVDKDDRLNIKGLDRDLYKRVRIRAIQEGTSAVRWIEEAVKDKLGKKAESRK